MKNILLLLAKGFEAYEAAVFTDVMGFAKTGGVKIDLESAGTAEIINCAYGFNVMPDYLIEELDLDKYDALAIPGGKREVGFYEDSYSAEFQDVISYFYDNNKIIAGICVASFPIAQTGILKHKKATTYFGKKQKALAELGVDVSDKGIVFDNNIITSSSPANGLEVAFKLLELLTDQESVEKTKESFGLNR